VILIIIVGGIIIMFLGNKIIKSKKEINSIKLIEYGYGDGRTIYGHTSYTLKCDDKCILTTKYDGFPDEEVFVVEIDKNDIDKIIKLFQDNNVASWDGFSKSDKNVLDGTSFSFRVETKDNQKISASGYMKWPKNYREVVDGMVSIFDSANDKLSFMLYDHEKYKGFEKKNISKVIDEFYGEGGVETKEYTEENDINRLYDRFSRYKLGIETKQACEDNTHKYRFIMKDGNEYIIEEECDWIVLDGKRYIYRYA
jgi:hypothetical protein